MAVSNSSEWYRSISANVDRRERRCLAEVLESTSVMLVGPNFLDLTKYFVRILLPYSCPLPIRVDEGTDASRQLSRNGVFHWLRLVDRIGAGCNLHVLRMHNVLLDERLTRALTRSHYRPYCCLSRYNTLCIYAYDFIKWDTRVYWRTHCQTRAFFCLPFASQSNKNKIKIERNTLIVSSECNHLPLGAIK